MLDLSRVLAGPWAGQLLADYGADVIKVERPAVGDDTRAWGPPWWGDAADQMSAYYLSANRGKRSIAVDIATDDGAALVKQLAKHADVLLENYKVGQLAKYGLDHRRLAELNPRLIYCSITGYGQDGPYAPAAGYDFAIQATGGLMSVTGEKDGTPGAEPQKVGVAVADLFTGLYATTAILAALQERHRTGRGRWIDAALLDTQLAMLANQASNYLVGGKTPKRMGNAHVNVVPYQVFKTQDGHIVLAVGNDGQFQRFCKLAGREAVGTDALFATNALRIEHRDALTRRDRRLDARAHDRAMDRAARAQRRAVRADPRSARGLQTPAGDGPRHEDPQRRHAHGRRADAAGRRACSIGGTGASARRARRRHSRCAGRARRLARAPTD